MRIPLDVICVKSGVLCPRCRRLVESNTYTWREVEIMKHLLELEETDASFKFLKDATYVKAYETNSMIVVVIDVGADVPQHALIKLGRVLSTKLNTRVRVVRKSDPRNMILQIIAPARVEGINRVWTPDGDVQNIIRIPKTDARLLPSEASELERILSIILGENYRIKIG
ncbi:MAG: transcription elongation factor [Ignisphaera sp.]|nr:transcription elongation factor [Ignisphaera sp.]